MKLLAAAIAVACGTAATASAQGYAQWTISNSPSDPWSNTGPIAPGPTVGSGNLYLWLICTGYTSAPGMAAAEFDVVELAGAGAPADFTTTNGFLNAGTATELLLAVGFCPKGPVLAGAFTVAGESVVPDIELCIVPSAASGRDITVLCGGAWTVNTSNGFKKTGVASCSPYAPGCRTISVQQSSWGRIKGAYR